MNEKDKVMRRKEALFAVIGGIVGAVLTMVAGSFSPLGAQSQGADVSFGTITCEKLMAGAVGSRGIFVADSDNKLVVEIGSDEHGGVVSVGNGDKGSVEMSMDEHGGELHVIGNDGKERADMGVIADSGVVGVHGDDGDGVLVFVGENGGIVYVLDGGNPRSLD